MQPQNVAAATLILWQPRPMIVQPCPSRRTLQVPTIGLPASPEESWPDDVTFSKFYFLSQQLICSNLNFVRLFYIVRQIIHACLPTFANKISFFATLACFQRRSFIHFRTLSGQTLIRTLSRKQLKSGVFWCVGFFFFFPRIVCENDLH